MTPKTVLAD